MKVAVISSSQNPDSKGRVLCQKVHQKLAENKNISAKFFDLAKFELPHVGQKMSPKTENLKTQLEDFDHFIFGIAVYNYNVNDAFASFAGGILPKKEHSLYGLVVAAGGDLSYLAASAAHQMLMTHNRMIALPRILFGGRSWDGENMNPDLSDRLEQFCADFCWIGGRISDDR